MPNLPHLDEIFEGDCLDLLGQVPDGAVDLVISSPPYNIGKAYESKLALASYLESQKTVLTQCVRALRTTGSLFWQIGSFTDAGRVVPLDVRFFPMLEDLGLIPRNRIVWARQHGLHAQRRFSGRHETILWFTKTDDYFFDLDAIRVPQKYPGKKAYRGERRGELSSNPAGKNPGDVWAFRNVKHNHEEQTLHPAQFPEEMIARIVLATTRPDDVVMDPFVGSGTVAVVSRDLGRHFLGAEIDPDYVNIARRRLAGVPDERGTFPNLRSLRLYADRTGEPPARYRFDAQVGSAASAATAARIFDEGFHRDELMARLEWEADAASAGRSGGEPPAWATRLVPPAEPALPDPVLFPTGLPDDDGAPTVG